MANRYARLAAMYFAASLNPTNYMHRFCHRPLAAHSQKQNRKALNVLRRVGIFDTAALLLTADCVLRGVALVGNGGGRRIAVFIPRNVSRFSSLWNMTDA
jgi:hypothetical protein